MSTTLDEVLKGGGFTSSEIQDIKGGKLVKGTVSSTNDRELAARFAFLVKAPTEGIIKNFMDSSRKQENDPNVTALGNIGSEADISDFSGVKLEPNATATAADFLGAKAGADLNFSTSEIKAFQDLKKKKAGVAEVEAQLRKVLLDRCREYQKGGLKGISPYARSSGKNYKPGDELRLKTDVAPILKKKAPQFHKFLMDCPNAPSDGIEESYSWSNTNIDDVPTYALVHKASQLVSDDAFVFSQRHFYVTKGHNSVQGVGGAFSVGDEETIIIYLTRTSTDRVSGFGGSTKRAIGAKVMGGKIAENMERVRDNAATWSTEKKMAATKI